MTSGLAACDDRTMDKTFADIQAIKVDARDPDGKASAADRSLGKDDANLVMNTARDLTVRKGGLLDKTYKSGDHKTGRMEIAVVDPLMVPRPDNNPPLDERLRGVVFDLTAEAQRAAAHDLPDIPVAQAMNTPPQMHMKPLPALPQIAERKGNDARDDSDRRIQIGSFGTLAAAQNAWDDLRSRYPGVAHFSPRFETVTTASGKSMVRLKVGPVTDEAQARGLCDKLDIRDTWCARAG